VRQKSIRWRLSYNFLGIAGLSVLLLGFVLFLILRAYYTGLEQSYLRGAAQAIPNDILDILKSEDGEAELQGYFENVAFLSQTRVKISNSDGDVLVDTGSPMDYSVGLGIQSDYRGTTLPGEERIIEPYIVVQMESSRLNRIPQDDSQTLDDEQRIRSIESEITATEIPGQRESDDTITIVVTAIPKPEEKLETILNEIPVYSTTFGFSFGVEDASLEDRSRQELEISIYDIPGLLATIEFSEGPAFGRRILSNVAVGFIVSGVLAIGLAAFAGWWLSLRISSPLVALAESASRIAAGDYTGRVDIEAEDEFGSFADSFNAMAKKVEGTVTALRRFVSDAAHELNTPLTALRTNLDLISDEEDVSTRTGYVERALKQTQKLEQITRALLDLSMLEAGSSQEEAELIDLTVLVREQSESFASTAEQGGLEFALELPDENIEIVGCPDQVRRAYNNLLDNAIKFTPQGGKVSVGIKREGKLALLYVEDTGIGIPEEATSQLFQRFYRASNASAYPGSGLGLAIVQAIMERHGGVVRVERKEQGARFIVNFPLAG